MRRGLSRALAAVLGVVCLVAMGPTPKMASPVAPAPQQDLIGERLANARALYELQMEGLRDRTVDSICSRETKERMGANPRLDVLASILNERAQFETAGQWPNARNADSLRLQASSIATSMVEAYKQAKKDYVRNRNDALAAIVEKEMEQFLRQNDLACWSQSLEDDDDAEDRGTFIGQDKAEIDLGYDVGEEYRLEIIGRRVEGNGSLFVDVPLPTGKILEMKPAVSDKGTVRLLVSLRESCISPDLGVARPIDMNAARDGERALALRADDGKFAIDTIRTKRIGAGNVEVLAQRAKRPIRQPWREGPAVAKGEDRLGAAINLRGHIQWHDDKARVGCIASTSREGNVVTIQVEHSNSKLFFDCVVKGDSLDLKAVRPGRGYNATIREAKGHGKVEKDGIRLIFRWLEDGDVKNRLVEGTLRLTREN